MDKKPALCSNAAKNNRLDILIWAYKNNFPWDADVTFYASYGGFGEMLNYAISNGFITGDTIYFNNLAQTKQDLLDKWLVPVKNSWLSSRIKSSLTA